jgi:hypothetical protein
VVAVVVLAHRVAVVQAQLVVVVVVEQFGDPHHLQVLKQVMLEATEILLLQVRPKDFLVVQLVPADLLHSVVVRAVAELVVLEVAVFNKRLPVQQTEFQQVEWELLALLPDRVL